MPDDNNQTNPSNTPPVNQNGSDGTVNQSNEAPQVATTPRPVVEEVSDSPIEEVSQSEPNQTTEPDTQPVPTEEVSGDIPPLPNPDETAGTTPPPTAPENTQQEEVVSATPTPSTDNQGQQNNQDATAEKVTQNTNEENTTNSDAEGLGIPPVIPAKSDKPKRSFGKKTIATVLGILLLVGGLISGVTLVQRNQDIREQAAQETTASCAAKGQVYCGGCINGCVTDEERTINGQTVGCNYLKQQRCGTPEQKGGTGTGSENSDPSQKGSLPAGVGCDSNGCTGNGQCLVIKYQCDRNTNLGGGCQDKRVDASNGRLTFSASCGAEQIDVSCSGGGSDFVSRIYAKACVQETEDEPEEAPPSTPKPTPTPTTPPGLTAQCLDVSVWNEDFSKKFTTDELKTLKAGDKINLVVGGTATSGTFTQARFTVNGALRAPVTQKPNIVSIPENTHYFDAYTIPDGVKSFTVKGEIHHSTAGWF